MSTAATAAAATAVVAALTGCANKSYWPARDEAAGGCDYSLRIGECIAYVREPDPGDPWTAHADRHCAHVWLTYPDQQKRTLKLARRDTPMALDTGGRPHTAECAAFDILPEAH